MSIVATGTVAGFFHEIVEDAIRVRRLETTGVATNYIVSLLSEYARPDARAEQAFARPLAFLLDEALHTPDLGERFEKLRSLGDGVLYTSGFFGDHFEARGVDQKYLIGIGATAYGTASSLLHPPSEKNLATDLDIFRELAEKFAGFVDVLAEVANATIAMGVSTSKNVLKIYERWLKTGNERLAHALSSQGLVPTRGGKGVVQ